jgi:hypothetical protein
LLIVENATSKGGDPIPKFIIEVKRAAAPVAQINADLRRLAAARKALRDVRAFLFVISEAKRPSRFVDKKGISISGKRKIPQSDGHYTVRTWKAAHAYTKRDKAQYACLVEVFAPKASRRGSK